MSKITIQSEPSPQSFDSRTGLPIPRTTMHYIVKDDRFVTCVTDFEGAKEFLEMAALLWNTKEEPTNGDAA